MRKELIKFVRASLKAGQTRADIARALAEAGWSKREIDKALYSYADNDFPIPTPRPAARTTAAELFVYLIMFGALYFTIWAAVDLIFYFIDLTGPEIARFNRFDLDTQDRARYDIATLVVAAPLFLFVFRKISNHLAQDAAARESGPRKGLTYLTLSLAVFTIACSLCYLVYQFLDGELTYRFSLKVCVLIVISGGVGAWFYRDDSSKQSQPENDRRLSWGVATSAAALIIAGLAAIAPPWAQRALVQNKARLNDLKGIASDIENYYKRTQTLPRNLTQLKQSNVNNWRSVVDRESGAPFEYQVLTPQTYELCATFAPEGAERKDRRLDKKTLEFLARGGRQCFEGGGLGSELAAR